MLHYSWRVLNFYFEKFPIGIIFIICFQLKRFENGIKDSLSKVQSLQTGRGSYLNLEVSIFVYIFELYLVTQSL
jgi:hypothetical protein